MSGWIKLHRQILEWGWYADNNTFRVFMHLILKANHKEKRYKGIELKSGSVITSRDILALETGLSVQQIRTALDKLKSTNEITITTSPKGTIIQVVKYEKYQVATNEVTNEQPMNNQQVTINNKEKKENNNIAPEFSEFLAYALEKKPRINQQDLRLKYDSWIVNGWCTNKDGKFRPIVNWKSTLLNTLPFIKEIVINVHREIVD